MSDALDELRNQATMWYMGLDERTQAVVEAAYAEVPDVVVRAIGVTELGDAELGQHTTLASLLDAADGDPVRVLPFIAIEGGVAFNPQAPSSVDVIQISWTDINYGAATEGYVDRIGVLTSSNDLVSDESIQLGALDAGGRATVTHTIGPLPYGDYTIRIVHNAEGVEQEQARYATRKVGILTYTDIPLTVTLDAGTVQAGQEVWQAHVAKLVEADDLLRHALTYTGPGWHLAYADAIDAYAASPALAGLADAAELHATAARIRAGFTSAREDDEDLTDAERNVLSTSAAYVEYPGDPSMLMSAVTVLAREVFSETDPNPPADASAATSPEDDVEDDPYARGNAVLGGFLAADRDEA